MTAPTLPQILEALTEAQSALERDTQFIVTWGVHYRDLPANDDNTMQLWRCKAAHEENQAALAKVRAILAKLK